MKPDRTIVAALAAQRRAGGATKPTTQETKRKSSAPEPKRKRVEGPSSERLTKRWVEQVATVVSVELGTMEVPPSGRQATQAAGHLPSSEQAPIRSEELQVPSYHEEMARASLPTKAEEVVPPTDRERSKAAAEVVSVSDNARRLEGAIEESRQVRTQLERAVAGTDWSKDRRTVNEAARSTFHNLMGVSYPSLSRSTWSIMY